MGKKNSIKKAILFTLLFVYGFALIKPVFPLVEDLFAHTFFESSHKTSVHFENGKYHLHVELVAEALQQKDNQKEKAPSVENEKLEQHFRSRTENLLIEQLTTGLPFPSYLQPTEEACIQLTSPPPEV